MCRMRPKEHALQQQEETSLDETKNCFFCVQVSNASTEGRPHSGKSGLEGNDAVRMNYSNKKEIPAWVYSPNVQC